MTYTPQHDAAGWDDRPLVSDADPGGGRGSGRRPGGDGPRKLLVAIVVGLIIAALALVVIALGIRVFGSNRQGIGPTGTGPVDDGQQAQEATATPGGGISELSDPAWTKSVAQATATPARAMRAYAGAALKLQEENASCGIGWNTIAAVGFFVSGHGTVGGGEVDAYGLTPEPLVDVDRYDGSSARVVADTDGGRIDGDGARDHSLGPMQLLPAEIDRYGGDGNEDGTIDPQQIDDAAYTLGRFLCASGGDLRDEANWREAVDAVDPSGDFTDYVTLIANDFAERASSVPSAATPAPEATVAGSAGAEPTRTP